jgi:Sigma-70, region 4
VHGFAATAVEFVNLSAATESVGEDHRARCSAWAPAAVTRCCTRRSRGIVGYVLGSPADLIEDSKAIQPGEAASFTLLQEQLHSVLGTPSEREAGMVTMRFGLTDGQPKTLGEIGKVYGVTRKRIRQIESTTMSKLRHPSRSKVLRDYLD